MQLEVTTTDRRSRLVRYVALVVGGAGVMHFILSLVVWGFFYVASYRSGLENVLTVAYGARHLSPVFVLLGLFGWASWGAFRCKRFVVPLLVCSVLLSLGAFAVEVRDDPQFQRVWFEENRACSSRQNVYCTWWWWQPQIR